MKQSRSSKKEKEKFKEKPKGYLLEVLGGDTREVEAVRAGDQKEEKNRRQHRSRSRFHFDGQ